MLLSSKSFNLFKDSLGENGIQSPNQNDCGTWVRNINGGVFTSPKYPDTYPPNKECVYILEGEPGALWVAIQSSGLGSGAKEFYYGAMLFKKKKPLIYLFIYCDGKIFAILLTLTGDFMTF